MKRLLSVAILSVCMSAAHAAVAVNQAYDKYARSTSLTTSQLKVEDGTHGFFDPSFAKAWLSASVGKSGAIAYALNVYFYSGNGWVFFGSARDSDGAEFPFTSVDRSVIVADTVSEQFLVMLTPDYLAAHRAAGLDLKFYGKGREMLVAMPPEQLEAILAAATTVAATAAASASSAPAAVAAASAP